ncbi:MAG TPA: hypothetical protein VMA55_18875 [Acidovorax sp.]|nr:hypothetical protein [Acidovorax sp.]
MKKTMFALAFAMAGFAHANCVGGPGFQTCTDLQSGNTYQVQRFGNTTTINGHNSNTGTSWNQTTQTYGNTTQHRGTASNGQSWNGTTINNGNGFTQQYGTDSNGRNYNKSCGPLGCF